MEWAAAVEEVLDLLQIGQCSVMAHSAGAPYALSFANKVPGRIKGAVCLLAPWVGGREGGELLMAHISTHLVANCHSGSYKWLKYVPNGILKTAQAAEWKIQAWMIGKPPRLAFEGIGHIAASRSTYDAKSIPRCKSPLRSNGDTLTVSYPSMDRRPSFGSGTFSEYDDLGDFDGRFESRSTLGAMSVSQQGCQNGNDPNNSVSKRKLPRNFLRRRKAGSTTQSPVEEKAGASSAGRKLKALRSMSSLKAKASASATSRKSDSAIPKIPPALNLECPPGFDEFGRRSPLDPTPAFTRFSRPDDFYSTLPKYATPPNDRANGRRSISFSAPAGSPKSMPSSPSSPVPSTFSSPYSPSVPGIRYQAALGNALIAASHAESANGTHSDLLQVLNRENHSWGFSYATYPHNVRVWYGDKDEKIAENGIRWMERTMGDERCHVKVVKGADHGLMYKSSVVVEILEHFREYWRDGAST
jgi:pimeloyl-ACP methyl ester carboxylesterase